MCAIFHSQILIYVFLIISVCVYHGFPPQRLFVINPLFYITPEYRIFVLFFSNRLKQKPKSYTFLLSDMSSNNITHTYQILHEIFQCHKKLSYKPVNSLTTNIITILILKWNKYCIRQIHLHCHHNCHNLSWQV